jgi:hypothetical protein
LEFVVGLNAAAKGYNESRTPFAVVNLSYENEREIVREMGLRQFAQTRDQFLENLKNELRGHGGVVKGHSYDFCLIDGMSLADADSFMSGINEKASSNLRLDLGIRFQLFGPEDFT